MRWPYGMIHGAQITADQFTTLTDALTPAETMALTALREAESRLDQGRWVRNPLTAQVDILEVIDTRVQDHRWQLLGHKGVCLQRWQFSCWLVQGGADNHFRLLTQAQQLLLDHPTSPLLTQLVVVAEGCLGGGLVHTLDGATHYYADTLTTPPAWAAPPARRVEARYGHIFYAGVP